MTRLPAAPARLTAPLLAGLLLIAGCTSSTPKRTPTPADAGPTVASATAAAVATARPTATSALGATASASITPSSARPPTASPAAGTAGAFETLLAVVPDTKETRGQVTMNNFALARQQHNISAPSDPADQVEKAAYLEKLAPLLKGGAGTSFISGMGTNAQVSKVEQYLGYRRVDQDLQAGLPPSIFEAVRGAFDPKAADQAIRACGDCTPPDRAAFQGVPYYSWGADYANNLRQRLAPPAYDSLGRGGRVAVTDQYVFRTVWTAGLTEMITGWHGGRSLGKDESFVLAARGLDEIGTYTAFLTDQTEGPGSVATPPARPGGALASPAAGGPLLQPYEVVAAGAGVDSAGQAFTGIALVHRSAQEARENAQLLPLRIAQTSSILTGRPWSTVIPAVDVRVEGRVLLATMKGSGIGAAFLLQRDPLLQHR